MGCGLVSLALLAVATEAAQDTADTRPPLTIDGPAPPHPPDVISRDANGRATMRAIRLVEPLRVDGALNERVYIEVPAVTDFIQKEPVEGALATEKSEVWVLFDDEQLYISFRCWAENPEAELAASCSGKGVSTTSPVGLVCSRPVKLRVDSASDSRTATRSILRIHGRTSS